MARLLLSTPHARFGLTLVSLSFARFQPKRQTRRYPNDLITQRGKFLVQAARFINKTPYPKGVGAISPRPTSLPTSKSGERCLVTAWRNLVRSIDTVYHLLDTAGSITRVRQSTNTRAVERAFGSG